jgi:hypothetical protein
VAAKLDVWELRDLRGEPLRGLVIAFRSDDPRRGLRQGSQVALKLLFIDRRGCGSCRRKHERCDVEQQRKERGAGTTALRIAIIVAADGFGKTGASLAMTFSDVLDEGMSAFGSITTT